MGKTIMLSIGGETAWEYLTSELQAVWFADFLWYSFGPQNEAYTDAYPRPFLTNSVNGFDFDIEHDGGACKLIFHLSIRPFFEKEKPP